MTRADRLIEAKLAKKKPAARARPRAAAPTRDQGPPEHPMPHAAPQDPPAWNGLRRVPFDSIGQSLWYSGMEPATPRKPRS